MTQLITRQERNRTLLHRQFLLERQSIPILQATEHLLALQSQIPNPPYIGLWTRLHNFERDNLTQLLNKHDMMRVPWIRSTLHLISADDHQRFRHIIGRALERGLRSFYGRFLKDIDLDELVEYAHPFIESSPRTTGELREFLSQKYNVTNPDALAYAIRTYIPLVQVPPAGTYGSGTKASYTPVEGWIQNNIEPQSIIELFKKYLQAYGPASIMDFQFWLGITKLNSELKSILPALVAYQDEDGQTLYDLPELPIIAGNYPAPIRFIPEYDNLLMGHKKRTHYLEEKYRKRVFLSAARVLGTILVDGMVQATWKIRTKNKNTTLSITPFDTLPHHIRDDIESEANRLLVVFGNVGDNQIIFESPN